jgi:hypothetical protein
LAFYPIHQCTSADAKKQLEDDLRGVLILPKWIDKTLFTPEDIERISKAKRNVADLLAIMRIDVPSKLFLSEWAEEAGADYQDLLDDCLKFKSWIDLAYANTSPIRSRDISTMQRRLLSKSLSTTWWFITGLEATRGTKSGTFGYNLLCIVTVLSCSIDNFQFLGNLNESVLREKLVTRMLRDIDRTKSKRWF